MLADISTLSANRLREVRSYLNVIKAAVGPPPSALSVDTTTAKGLFFVHLYGAYEFSVCSSVQKTLETINGFDVFVADFKPVMLSVVLDAQCRSLAEVGPNKTWEKRWELFKNLTTRNIVRFDTSVMPTGSGNLKYPQLQSIWTTLCVPQPVLPRMSLQSRLEELVEHRNAISHGRESPAAIGGRYTITELEKRLDDIEELCAYLISCLENYLLNFDFLAG